jgi:hypothetical protein
MGTLRDMTDGIFEDTYMGKLALIKMKSVPENFRLFFMGWMEEKPEHFETMKVTGCEFRHAKSGPNKGKLCIEIKDTRRSVYLSKDEISKFEG